MPHFGGEEEEEIYQPVTSISQAPSISSGNNSSLLYANVEPVYPSLASEAGEGNFYRDYRGRNSLRDKTRNSASLSTFNSRSSQRLPSRETPLEKHIHHLSEIITLHLGEIIRESGNGKNTSFMGRALKKN